MTVSQRETPLEIRQNKSLNVLVEKAPRAIKRRVRAMRGVQNCRGACIVLGGLAAMPMIRKGQRLAPKGRHAFPAEQCCALAA